ncbi:MAG: NAD(P)(+) transhydrogenase (Re/Si-specific) subunit beta [Deltaproteobacteria bacterium]|nr:NAD(P)(+) transhydrogenase (Re/Si-specific) subunit beta [Deltaproteobacteria bacterium]
MDLQAVIRLIYLFAAALFILGLHKMNSPATARAGNRLSAFGMLVAVLATAVMLGRQHASTTGWIIVGGGTLLGGGVGALLALRVPMTSMPEMVSLFNAVGGGAAALVAVEEFRHLAGLGTVIPAVTSVTTVLGGVIGAMTFTGSIVAFGKLQGFLPGRPLTFPGYRLLNGALALGVLGAFGYELAAGPHVPILFGATGLACLLGVLTVTPIGGGDMPVVISLLNSFTGTAAAMAGFVINNSVLIIAGALVGASGMILTQLMSKAMNRSLGNVLFGAFGTGDGDAGGATVKSAGGGAVREVSAEDVATAMGYARKVIVVPGYGMAVAQAQHAIRELAELLEQRGVQVRYAIHPVAGRMPGHMNVLLAEANVPYPQLVEMEEINPEFKTTDVALVVGANDIINPAARNDPSSPIYGMPILDVDQAAHIVINKRSMRSGFAGIDNELFTNPKTGMLFGDSKDALTKVIEAVKAL